MSIAKRGRLYHLRRRVPRRYRGIEPRETVWISLHTDSETIARSKADRAWSQMIEAWEARLAGNSADAEARYEAARDLAWARGFRYLDAGAVAKLPIEDIVERVEAIPAPANQPNAIETAAILGTVPEPRFTMTCHGIFPPFGIRVRPDEGTDHEANEIYRRADHRHFDRA
jgi:hypothetical protein